jgi:hypothetical protein
MDSTEYPVFTDTTKLKEYATNIAEMLSEDYEGNVTYLDLLDVLAIFGYTITPSLVNEASTVYIKELTR